MSNLKERMKLLEKLEEYPVSGPTDFAAINTLKEILTLQIVEQYKVEKGKHIFTLIED